MHQQVDAIVVAVGPEGSPAAVDFAVDHAAARGARVHLVHVFQLTPPEVYAGAYDEALQIAEVTLAQATAAAQTRAAGHVTVTRERVANGWLVGELVQRADTAAMIVLEHRHLSGLRRLVTGSVVNGVASRAGVPVVSVPQGWRPTAHGRVVVALQDPEEGDGLLREAAAQALVSGSRMTVLHAWWLAGGFDAAIADETVRAQWRARAAGELSPLVAALESRHPDLDVVLEVRHAPPADALLEAAADADLLVIGRRQHRLPFGTHLGPVARSVIAHSPCPVLLAPESRGSVARQITANSTVAVAQ